MMDFITSTANELSLPLSHQLAEYRYKVFIEKLGWELDTPPGIEQDQFDTPDTLYVIARGDNDRITGCARLLPTTSPYLLEEVFPELLNGMPVPKENKTWELSRFTALDLDHMDSTQGQLSAETTLSLLDKVVEYAKQQGAERLISVSPLGVERLLRNTRYHFHRAGPPKVIDGYPLLACWIDIA